LVYVLSLDGAEEAFESQFRRVTQTAMLNYLLEYLWWSNAFHYR